MYCTLPRWTYIILLILFTVVCRSPPVRDLDYINNSTSSRFATTYTLSLFLSQKSSFRHLIICILHPVYLPPSTTKSYTYHPHPIPSLLTHQNYLPHNLQPTTHNPKLTTHNNDAALSLAPPHRLRSIYTRGKCIERTYPSTRLRSEKM